MQNKIKFSHIILTVVILSAVHLIFLKTEFYGNRSWIDVPLHFIMGAFLGAIFLWWQGRKLNVVSRRPLVVSLFLFGLFGGIVWEVVEFVLWNFLPAVGNYIEIKKTPVRDIFSDLLFDVLGSLTWLIFVKIKKMADRKKEKK